MSTFRNALIASLLSGPAGTDSLGGLAPGLDGQRQAPDTWIDVEPLSQLEAQTRALLDAHGFRDVVVSSRHKSPLSTALKMRRKGITLDQVADRRGVRIVVPTIEDCYRVLGLLHGEHIPVPTEQDDYIAAPKANGYRSLHSAVHTLTAGVVEFQVRTYAMHDHAEYGAAAHRAYKASQLEDLVA